MRERWEMNKICNFCGNKNFKEKRVQYIYKHDDRFLVMNNVPVEEFVEIWNASFCYKKEKLINRNRLDFVSPFVWLTADTTANSPRNTHWWKNKTGQLGGGQGVFAVITAMQLLIVRRSEKRRHKWHIKFS